MSRKSYVIIGSNCFTGSHIVDALLEDPQNQVVGISRSHEYKDFFLPYKRWQNPQFRFYQIDLVRQFGEVVQLLDKVKPQVVINVAALSEVALSHERPVEYFETNTLGVVKLCNHLRACSYLEHYVHVSSAEIFGSCEKPVTEEMLFNSSTPYAVSKAAADMYLNTLIENFGFPATLIRSTNVYGKHQQLFKIIPRTVIYLKLGKIIELHGGGVAIKSFIHIRDVVHGLLLALEQGKPGAYHFTVASDQTVADIVRQICTWMGYDFESTTHVVGERLGQDARYWLDCSKAERDLGWAPQVPFEQGAREVIEWIESNWAAIQRESLVYIHKA
ncbi:MAG: dTDP-glucose 4,6-dehydratase 2 [Syntrophomonadaceae bacterium]|nr:dTDP-glucose 4,6-dehydratase 2 [Bacillota bacterium]MBT9146998.1 dTDP-glucose 4,6-dehydratase 2 [Bacillota bacterium]